MKRHNDGDLQTGLIYADHVDLPSDDAANGPVIVWDVWPLPGMKAAVALTNGAKPPWRVHGSYPTVEAMLSDGWVVD
jgi:hypothetical protein